MSYRTFKDSRGTEWQTWDVVPRLGERRVNDRRSIAAHPLHSDRRLRTERRVLTGHRSLLAEGLDNGWLCFEAPQEKRRLTPIPPDWLNCGVDCLEAYCREAKLARRIMPMVDILKVDDN